jgi:predicted lipoprotein with Yx(FWY)xxD motif
VSRALATLIACAGLAVAGCGSDGDSGESRADEAAGRGETSGAEMANSERDQGKADGGTNGMAAEPQAAAKPPRGPLVKLRDSQFGPVLFAGRDRALYLFTRDPKNKTRCYGACAAAWPPLFAKGRPRAASGVDASLLGTIKRRDGRRQVTYKGQALYFYVADPRGEVLCNDVVEFGGTWYAVDAKGNPPA